MSVFRDPDADAASLAKAAYDGHLIVLRQLPAVRQLVDYVRQELAELFSPHDPEHVHEHVEPSEMARLLGAWKPAFIHGERSTRLVREISQQAGFSPDATYYDLPKPRTSFPVGHLTTGIAYAFPWHRDTWYAAPLQQLNWWLPVWPVRVDNTMGFDLESFDRSVPNTSATFDYYENNVARLSTASQVGRERQARPAAPGHQPAEEWLALLEPGEILIFSGAQLHRSRPNTSGLARYSVDFRTVSVADLESGRGAPSLDVRCTGTAIRDFHRVSDERAFTESLVVSLFGQPPPGAKLVFEPSELEQATPAVPTSRSLDTVGS